MITSDWWQDIASFSFGALELALALLVQSSVLIAIGLLAARVFKRKGSAMASAIYRTTLVAVLACPAVSLLFLAAGVPGIALPMLELGTPATEIAGPATTPQVAGASEQALDGTPASDSDAALTRSTGALADAKAVDVSASGGDVPTRRKVSVDYPSRKSGESAVAAKAETASGLDLFATLACAGTAVWLVVSGVLLLRLASGQILVWRLRRRAHPAKPETTSRCRDLAGRMGIRCPLVLRSPFVSSPCLIGMVHPAILLPEKEEGAGGG